MIAPIDWVHKCAYQIFNWCLQMACPLHILHPPHTKSSCIVTHCDYVFLKNLFKVDSWICLVYIGWFEDTMQLHIYSWYNIVEYMDTDRSYRPNGDSDTPRLLIGGLRGAHETHIVFNISWTSSKRSAKVPCRPRYHHSLLIIRDLGLSLLHDLEL